MLLPIALQAYLGYRKRLRGMGGPKINLEAVDKLPFSAARKRMWEKANLRMCWLCRYHYLILSRIKVAFQSDYDCGSLLCPIDGDPYVRSQRLLVVMITLLCRPVSSRIHCFLRVKREPLPVEPEHVSHWRPPLPRPHCHARTIRATHCYGQSLCHSHTALFDAPACVDNLLRNFVRNNTAFSSTCCSFARRASPFARTVWSRARP